jgi:hypothetical protein
MVCLRKVGNGEGRRKASLRGRTSRFRFPHSLASSIHIHGPSPPCTFHYIASQRSLRDCPLLFIKQYPAHIAVLHWCDQSCSNVARDTQDPRK